MPDLTITDINKNGRESIRLAIRAFKGSRNVDIRVYATNANAEKVPTSKGISVRPTLLRLTIDALLEAERALIADGTLTHEASN